MATEILHKIAGEDGLEAHVAKIDRGYSVALFYTEEAEYVTAMPVKIFKTEAEAVAYANTING